MLRLAVIGDSDSHAFHDSVTFVPGAPVRGGAERARTFQWTEVLQRLRGDTIDLGAWGARGASGRVARVAGWVGVRLRTPRKQDFAYNVSYSGHRCANLEGPRGQLAQLRRLLDADPAGWRGGVVVIRIGINDLGRREVLDAVARDGLTADHRAVVDACTSTILAAARGLRDAHPAVRIVLAGIADNAGWPPNHGAFRSAEAMERLGAFHEAFDAPLRAFATSDTDVAFLDERGFFAERWGGRATDGSPAYRALEVAGIRVTPTQGDGLGHLVVADGHAGTVVNTLWAQRLVDLLATDLGLPVPRITDAEVEAFLRGLAAAR